mmetsp:Transcript_97159/g.299458  ORF Transcript_97159/g.299458 Transcript_97159/m.299458 type:complete len:408 (-) Transcript_97159:281-1504(-)
MAGLVGSAWPARRPRSWGASLSLAGRGPDATAAAASMAALRWCAACCWRRVRWCPSTPGGDRHGDGWSRAGRASAGGGVCAGAVTLGPSGSPGSAAPVGRRERTGGRAATSGCTLPAGPGPGLGATATAGPSGWQHAACPKRANGSSSGSRAHASSATPARATGSGPWHSAGSTLPLEPPMRASSVPSQGTGSGRWHSAGGALPMDPSPRAGRPAPPGPAAADRLLGLAGPGGSSSVASAPGGAAAGAPSPMASATAAATASAVAVLHPSSTSPLGGSPAKAHPPRGCAGRCGFSAAAAMPRHLAERAPPVWPRPGSAGHRRSSGGSAVAPLSWSPELPGSAALGEAIGGTEGSGGGSNDVAAGAVPAPQTLASPSPVSAPSQRLRSRWACQASAGVPYFLCATVSK